MAASGEALNYAIAFKQESEGLERAYITIPYHELSNEDLVIFLNELKDAFRQIFPFNAIEIHKGKDNLLIAKR